LISTGRQDVTRNDFDPDGDVFSVVSGVQNSRLGALVTLNPNGTFVYEPRAVAAIRALTVGQTLDDTFTYRLRDVNNAVSNPVTVTITVIGTNDVVPQTSARLASIAPASAVQLVSDGAPVATDDQLTSNVGTLEIQVGGSLHQNPKNRLDVNNDGIVSPMDALLVINYLNDSPRVELSLTAPVIYLDVDGDGSIFPMDVLLVINYLNEQAISGEGEGEQAVARQVNMIAAPPVVPTSSVSVKRSATEQAQAQTANVRGVEAAFASSASSFTPAESSYANGLDAVASKKTSEVVRRKSTQNVDSALEGFLDELGMN